MLLLSTLLACSAADPLAPSLDLGATPLAQHLPAQATLLVGAELGALDQAPLFEVWLEAMGLDRAGLDAKLNQGGGLPGGLEAVERLVGACDAQGCAALVEGQADGVDLERLARQARRGLRRGGQRGLRVEEAAPDRVLGRHRGARTRAEQLGPRRLVLGHEQAALALARPGRGAQGVEALDIPGGDLWFLARRPEQMRDQIQTFLRSSGLRGADRLLAQVQRAQLPWAAEGLVAVAAALRLEDAALVLRARFDGVWGATQAERLLREALRAETWLDREPEALDAVLDSAIVRRAGDRVEVELRGLVPAAQALLAEEPQR